MTPETAPKYKKRPPRAFSDGDEYANELQTPFTVPIQSGMELVMIAQNKEILDGVRLTLINNILLP